LEPVGAMRFLAAAQELTATDGIAKERLLFWTYRTLGPQLRSPALAAIWLQCQLNAMLRLPSVLRTLGPDWQARSPFEVAAELFRRILDHPEGVEIARIAEDTNLEDHLGFEDGRIRLAPEPMLGEIGRAVASPPAHDASFPFVLAAGLRTRWTANTIQRDPAWRKGRGPHCALNLSPADARDLGLRDGDRVHVATRRGAVTLPAQIDPKLLPATSGCRTASAWCTTACSTARTRTATTTTGFRRQAATRSGATFSWRSPPHENTITGIDAISGSCICWTRNSKPSITGSIRSSRIKEAEASRSRARASRPSPAHT